MSYRDQMQDTDQYDGWGDNDDDPRDYSRQDEAVCIVTPRFPAGQAARIDYQVPGTDCYVLDLPAEMATDPAINASWQCNAYALGSELRPA